MAMPYHEKQMWFGIGAILLFIVVATTGLLIPQK
jgi:hypothetical protein